LGAVVGLTVAVVLCLASPTKASQAAYQVRAVIDLSEQRMYLFVNGRLHHKWPVSTARRGYRTPVGTFKPIRLEREWYSRKYHWSPMPYSVFFLGGYAIHGTTEVRRLGRPVSHGCIRLHPRNAATFFRLVQQTPRKDTAIVIRR
jgi:lipoprotein-anchoring transpeptidase ErfK/SrfK